LHLDIVPLTIGVLAALGAAGFIGSVAALRDPTDLIRRIRGGRSDEPSARAPERAAADLGRHLGPLARLTGADEAEMSRLRIRLGWAGHRGQYAAQVFLASKVLLGAGALVAFAFLSTVRAEPLPHALALAVATVGVAFFLPNLWLRSGIASRQRDIERALPDTLDLLVTCVEAGLALDAAFQRVSTELALAWPVLSEEMNLTSLEVRAGVARTEAMRRFADRTGVADLRSLSATLNQTEMFGTSVAAALRVQAEGMRVKRSQRAEEKAAYLAVKMMLPLAFCILPCLFAVILGPAAVNIMTILLKR
jgi:tight adherence protein C